MTNRTKPVQAPERSLLMNAFLHMHSRLTIRPCGHSLFLLHPTTVSTSWGFRQCRVRPTRGVNRPAFWSPGGSGMPHKATLGSKDHGNVASAAGDFDLKLPILTPRRVGDP